MTRHPFAPVAVLAVLVLAGLILALLDEGAIDTVANLLLALSLVPIVFAFRR